MNNSRRIHEPFVYAALLIALSGGFGLATILSGVIGFRLPLGSWWLATVQAHGHAQLFGWTGLFIIGVGLYFLPRLRGTTLARQELAPWVLVLFVAGITLRVVSQILLALDLAYQQPDPLWNIVVRAGLGASGVLEIAGTMLFLFMILSSFRKARPLVPDSPILTVRPYLAVAVASLVLAVLVNGFLSLKSALLDIFIYPSSGDNLVVLLMVFGFAIPMALAFSVRNLPLFMRLAFPPKHASTPILASYVTGLFCRLVGGVVEQPFGGLLSALGMAIQGASVLAFIWTFDVLLRRKQPWTASRVSPPPGFVETRKPTRTKYPDYGEYGRFELLILSAYGWLGFASLTALANGLWGIVTSNALVDPDVELHSLTLGFITLLIFGMAVRMLPGFSGKRRVASTGLVLATFVFGNVAALFRVFPVLAPDIGTADIVFGLSGAIGWIAVGCLGTNLWLTFRSRDDKETRLSH